ncbi:hypothetical protein BDM02DRAFT_3121906 [Thelephora ganbajun]|uniref:Uncharacterized protein n=1 Tax=Thelephora ganbajun TaxID=370292 RepID=A0ACB6Z4L3_THEGA|nr:hypothetical protein BDM02DRAFT_3121906 [Thelephora ganbajun]
MRIISDLLQVGSRHIYSDPWYARIILPSNATHTTLAYPGASPGGSTTHPLMPQRAQRPAEHSP